MNTKPYKFYRPSIFLAVGLFLHLSAPAWAGPDIQHWTLKNGTRVYFVASRELPMVQLSVVFDAGAARDIPSKNGLALLTNGLLQQGAGNRDADQIASALEDLGAELGSECHRDMAIISLRSLSDPELLNPALDILASLLTHPTFPENSLERERKRALIALQRRDESPANVVSQRFYTALYGNHPYALEVNGTRSSLPAISRADLLAYHERYYVGANALLAIVGDLSRREAHKLAERVAGQLPAGLKPPSLPPATQNKSEAGKVMRVNYPSSQSHILMGQLGIKRQDPDYFPLYVGNHILGGSGLVSRISEEIREKRGLSYSAYSYFSPMREAGPYILGLQTRNDQADAALNVLHKTLGQFIAAGPSPEELEAAKKNLTGGFPLRIDSNREIAEYLAVIGFYELPLDYLDKFIPQVEAVTAEQIQQAYQRRVQPALMSTVIVGGGGQ